jgi:hypothetical protein
MAPPSIKPRLCPGRVSSLLRDTHIRSRINLKNAQYDFLASPDRERHGQDAPERTLRRETWRETFKVIPKLPYSFACEFEDADRRKSSMQILDWAALLELPKAGRGGSQSHGDSNPGSAIEWTDATWNPVSGCTEISPGCDNRYAARFSERFRGVLGHPLGLAKSSSCIPSPV